MPICRGCNCLAKSGVEKETSAIGISKSVTQTDDVRTTVGAPEPASDFVDYEALRSELFELMDAPDWDDGSYAPLLIRLAWHSSGTYCAADGTGGSNGATMRYAVEAADPDNAGLGKARQLLEPLKASFPGVSVADLWILAAIVAIEHTGGPKIPFRGGRVDADEDRAIQPGRLPGPETGMKPDTMELDDQGRPLDWQNVAQHMRDVFGRMGISDAEIVPLLCGGHLYGRCHTEHSGYAGAWVENPTLFSNEYAADLLGDEWMYVTHDTTMPDGQPVPDEVRPAPGKRQYINMTKYNGEACTRAVRAAPDADEFQSGRYRCTVSWANCRSMPDTVSPIVGRVVESQEISLICVKVIGTSVRGYMAQGGWVSIMASGGTPLFERIGDLDLRLLEGRYRVLAESGIPLYKEGRELPVKLPLGAEFVVDEVRAGTDKGVLWGRVEDKWALLFSPVLGLPLAERVERGWNEKPRRPIKGQSGHQMMLVSDMVLLWDEVFRPHLEVYAEDEAKLKEDFGVAFKRLVELGCPWSHDRCPVTSARPVAAVKNAAMGCPFMSANGSQ